MINENLAFVFPGQGSQSIGMLAKEASLFSLVQENYSIASEILGYDLWSIVQNGPEDKLSETVNTQLAVLVADVSLWQIWQMENNSMPGFLAGHSLGEYAALVAANAIQLNEAIMLVYHRAQLMQSAVPIGEGAMAAVVGLTAGEVKSICDGLDDVEPANFNSPKQVVVAGKTAAIEKAMDIAQEKGAIKVVKLPMSVPSHCSLMQTAAEKFSAILDRAHIKAPEIRVINNVDAKEYLSANEIKDGLVRQLYSPVQWVETIKNLIAQGVKEITECGSGKVLSGLIKRISKDITLSHV